MLVRWWRRWCGVWDWMEWGGMWGVVRGVWCKLCGAVLVVASVGELVCSGSDVVWVLWLLGGANAWGGCSRGKRGGEGVA